MKIKLTLAGALLAFGLATPSFAAPASFGSHAPAAPAFNAAPIAATFAAHPGYGQYPGAFLPKRPAQWELVGQRNVNFRGGYDNIPVAGRERYAQVMLCVYNQPIRVNDLDVRFANGRSQDVAVRSTIGAGQCTRAIDLNGQRRDIKSVSLAARAIGFVPFGRGALVRVFAR